MDYGNLAQILGNSGAAVAYGRNSVIDETRGRIENQRKLEDIAKMKQELEFAAQDQPLKNEGLRLGNIGKDTSNQIDQFKLGVDKSLGTDHFVESAKADLQGKHIKSAKEGGDLLGQIGASLEKAPPGLEGNFARDQSIKILQSALGMPEDVARRAVMNPKSLIDMGKAMYQHSKAGITQDIKNEFATKLQAQKAADTKTVVELKTGSAEKIAAGHDATQLAVAKMRAGAAKGSRAEKDPATFEAAIVRIINAKASLDPTDPQYEEKLNALDAKQALLTAHWTTKIDNTKPAAVVDTGQLDRNNRPIMAPNRNAPPTKEDKLRDAKSKIGMGSTLKGADGKYMVGITGRAKNPRTGKMGTYTIIDGDGNIDFKDDK